MWLLHLTGHGFPLTVPARSQWPAQASTGLTSRESRLAVWNARWLEACDTVAAPCESCSGHYE